LNVRSPILGLGIHDDGRGQRDQQARHSPHLRAF
jgi:hypothetical protein